MSYRVPGPKAVEPKSLNIVLTAYTFSDSGLKFKDNHKLSIYLDDKELFSSIRLSCYLNTIGDLLRSRLD